MAWTIDELRRFLDRWLWLETRRDQLRERVARLLAMTDSVRSPVLAEDAVAPSEPGDPTYRVVSGWTADLARYQGELAQVELQLSQLERGLSTLTATQRNCLHLRYYDGMVPADVAGHMRLSPSREREIHAEALEALAAMMD